MTLDDARRLAGVTAALAVAILVVGVAGSVATAEDDATSPSVHTGNTVAHNQFTFAYRLMQTDREEAAKAFDHFLSHFPEDEKASDALYYRALIAWLAKDHHSARWFLSRIGTTVLVPDADVNLLRGQVLSAASKYQAAIDCLAKIDTNRLEEPNVRANVWLTRAYCYQRIEKRAAAAAALRGAAAIEGDLQSRALLDLAALSEQMGDLDEAIAALERAVALKKADVTPEAAYLAGELLSKQGKYDRAIEHYRTVIRHFAGSPRFAVSVVGMMWAQLLSGRNDEVLATFEKHGKSLPKNRRVTVWDLAATARQNKGDHQVAVALLDAILNDVRGAKIEDKVLYKLARSQYEMGRHEQMSRTIDRLRTVHAESPYQRHADLLQASSAVRQERFGQAEARLTAIIDDGRAHPHYAEALLQRGWLREHQRQAEAAASDYQRVLGEDLVARPEQKCDVALRLVNLYAQAGRHRKAVEQAVWLMKLESKTFKLDPLVEQEALYGLATALVRLKQFERAHEHLDRLLEEHPLSKYRTQAAYYDGLVLMSLDRHDDAIERFQTALRSDQLELPKRINALRLSSLHLRKLGKDEDAAKGLLHIDELSEGKGLQPLERLWLGRHLQEVGRHKTSITLLGPLVGRNPHVSGDVREEALFITARNRRALGEREEAAAAYTQVIAMAGPFDLLAWQEKADTLMELERFDEAIEEYAGLITRPETAVAARALFYCGLTHRAMAGKRARDNDPKGAAAANEEARSLLLRMTILYASAQLSPLPELAFIERAEIEADLGRNDQSRISYQELGEKFPGTVFASYARAMIDLGDGHTRSARSLLRQLRAEKLDRRLEERVSRCLEDLAERP
ncbi:MAG: hypothetical protein CMJ18_11175 [Phycisphaeraceae bacterium]|nr:hypothetical protein [Phycisphaeraceae bacterium]